ncbi:MULTISPECIES: hypothetical protein [Halorussus]|uniref:hypothetical protein n=1 Tax=Halorussus TaxID=1070314 RepID=UPI000E20EB22|nr:MULTISPECIES: hypothetical protein [Halorussus]NHN59577.1 hypothetical protein [Halorussus sp. JP-T4]
MTANQTTVNITVDCTAPNVSITAPEGYQYGVTVGVANILADSNSVSRSSFGSVEGNATVDLDERGIVFTIVQNESEDEAVVASDVTDCLDAGETATTTASQDDTEPDIEVDCEGDEVRFVADEDTEYVGKVSVIELSTTGTSTSSSTMTLAGNETVSIDGEAIVAAFASTDDLGGDRTVSVIRNCSPFGTGMNETETTAASETTTET